MAETTRVSGSKLYKIYLANSTTCARRCGRGLAVTLTWTRLIN
jgi:hypothetical protein